MNNPGAVVAQANVTNPTGLLHAYQATPLPNMPGPNQSFILSNHPQFGYYPFFPAAYAAYPHQWATLQSGNPYLAPAPMPQAVSQLGGANPSDALRLTDAGNIR
jgi:hypothetical protein